MTGEGRVLSPKDGIDVAMTPAMTGRSQTCPTCGGSGVVSHPQSSPLPASIGEGRADPQNFLGDLDVPEFDRLA